MNGPRPPPRRRGGRRELPLAPRCRRACRHWNFCPGAPSAGQRRQRMSLKSLCNPSPAGPARAATKRRPRRARAQLHRISEKKLSSPGTKRGIESWGTAYRCARGMKPTGAYKGLVVGIWHGCAPTRPGRAAEAWRQKRTQPCRLTRRASP